MIRIKNILIFPLLIAFISCNMHASNTVGVDDSFCGIDTSSSSTQDTSPPVVVENNPNVIYESFTTEYEGKEAFVESYFNHETKDFICNITIIQHEFSPEEKPSTSTSEAYQEMNTSSVVNTAREQDHFSEFTQDQRQQALKEAEEQKLEEKQKEGLVSQDAYVSKDPNIIREQDFPIGGKLYLGDNRKFDSEIILKNVHTLKDLSNALSSPIIQACFARINRDFKSKPVKRGRRGAEYNHNGELIFLDALVSGKVAQLINNIQHGPKEVAEACFNELKNLWYWKHDTFLMPALTRTGEAHFITVLGLDIMHIVERGLIAGPDYIEAHANEISVDTVQKCKEQCVLLQQKNDTKALFEVKQELFHRVLNDGKQANLNDIICLAIAEKALLDPINIVLGRIKHAPSAEAARKELHHLEIQILNYAKRENLKLMPDITARVVEQYDFDLLQTGEEIYRARSDYVHAAENQTIFSDNVQAILNNIKHNRLSSAHMELVNANQQITDALKARNITDPIEQQEYLVKDFGVDFHVVTKSTYQERPDFINLIKLFTPLDVPSITIDILNNNNDYESVANEFDKVAEQVLNNAQLCDLDYIPHVESQLVQSLQIMRSPRNGAEFVFHATVADHLMTDVQCHAHAIAQAQQIVHERSSALLVRALEKFIVGLNPIEQVNSIVGLAKDAGHLLYAGTSLAVDAVLHPIDTAANMVPSQSSCEFLVNTARLACDITLGSMYLSPTEYKARIDDFKEALSDMPLTRLTAEHWVDLTMQILADFCFCKGVGGAYRFVKEIEVVSKMHQEAKKVVEVLKRAIDIRFGDNPILVTTEGIVLKMSEGMKDVGKTIAESGVGKRVIQSVANMKEFFELPFGKTLIDNSQKTAQRFQHSPIYKITKDIPGTDLKKGCFYYLDRFHNDHIEVFDHAYKCVNVYNLDGTANRTKYIMAKQNGRNIKSIMKGK